MLRESAHNRITWSLDSLFEIEVEADDSTNTNNDLTALRAELHREIARTRTILREEFHSAIKHLRHEPRRRAPLPLP